LLAGEFELGAAFGELRAGLHHFGEGALIVGLDALRADLGLFEIDLGDDAFFGQAGGGVHDEAGLLEGGCGFADGGGVFGFEVVVGAALDAEAGAGLFDERKRYSVFSSSAMMSPWRTREPRSTFSFSTRPGTLVETLADSSAKSSPLASTTSGMGPSAMRSTVTVRAVCSLAATFSVE
jgi:hypothetical protein